MASLFDVGKNNFSAFDFAIVFLDHHHQLSDSLSVLLYFVSLAHCSLVPFYLLQLTMLEL